MVIVLENPAFGASGKFRNFGYFIWAKRWTLVQDNLGVKLLKKINKICFLFKWAQNILKYISKGSQIIASKFSIISSQCHFLNSLYHSFSAVVGTIGKFSGHFGAGISVSNCKLFVKIGHWSKVQSKSLQKSFINQSPIDWKLNFGGYPFRQPTLVGQTI